MRRPERWQWPAELYTRMRPDLFAAPTAGVRPCGCTADPIVFGPTCGPVRMSADAQERGAEINGTAPGHAGIPGSERQAASGDPGAAQGQP